MKKTLRTQVAIMGAGPAGLTLALYLGKLGVDFIVVDRKKSPSYFTTHCGYSSLVPSDFDLSEKVILQRWDAVKMHLPSGTITREVPSEFRNSIGYLDRKQLYTELFEKASKFGTFLFNETINSSAENVKGTIESIESSSYLVNADIFADCSGAQGVLTKKYLGNSSSDYAQGIEYLFERTTADHNTVELTLGGESSGGYGWIAPIGHYVNIGIGKFREAISEKPLIDYFNKFSRTPHENTPYLGKLIKKYAGILPTHLLPQFHYLNTIHIGDCVGQVNPVFGEGVKWIMESSKLAAPIINTAVSENDFSILASFTHEWNRKYRNLYSLGHLLREKARHADFSRTSFKKELAVNVLKNSSPQTLLPFFKGEITPFALAKMAAEGILRTPQQ